jgi:excisionase family DNA binding protein
VRKEKVMLMVDQAWFSVQDAAQYLGVSRPTIYRWSKEGKLPIYKIAAGVARVKKEDIEQLLAEAKPLYDLQELSKQK